MYPKIQDVIVLEDYMLVIYFKNGYKKRFDIKSKLCDMRFEPLRDISLFNSVKVDQGGYGISWNDEIDLSEYELWTHGELID